MHDPDWRTHGQGVEVGMMAAAREIDALEGHAASGRAYSPGWMRVKCFPAT
jgi:hypothetical protein